MGPPEPSSILEIVCKMEPKKVWMAPFEEIVPVWKCRRCFERAWTPPL